MRPKIKGEPPLDDALDFYRQLLVILALRNGGRIRVSREEWKAVPETTRMSIDPGAGETLTVSVILAGDVLELSTG